LPPRGSKQRAKAPAAPDKDRFRVIAVNRLARHEYDILEIVEAGIMLLGTEIKSVREGKANIRDAYARRSGPDVWLYGAHIAPYASASYMNHDPLRQRKLLLHKDQIAKLAHEVEAKKLTLVPLRLYIKDHHAKVELALVRGRKSFDKRAAIAEREAGRTIQRELRQRV
jgi:SsrA-binding protein